MPHGDRHIETTQRQDKYYIGQRINRYGINYIVTRIVEVTDRKTREVTYEIYGRES
jgi:hypothetical protein